MSTNYSIAESQGVAFHPGRLRARTVRANHSSAKKTIIARAAPHARPISTTGYTSRELYQARMQHGQKNDTDFLVVGSMGHALSIAQGVARAHPRRTVWCLDGDGAALMHLGALAASRALGLPNLRHVIFRNGVHESVGGQPTASPDISFLDLAAHARAVRVHNKHELQEGLQQGALLLEACIDVGTPTPLARPAETPLDRRDRFMASLCPRPPLPRA